MLRPLEQLKLDERSLVVLTIDAVEDSSEAWVDQEIEVEAAGAPQISLEEVRRALSGASGSLSDDVSRERDER